MPSMRMNHLRNGMSCSCVRICIESQTALCARTKKGVPDLGTVPFFDCSTPPGSESARSV